MKSIVSTLSVLGAVLVSGIALGETSEASGYLASEGSETKWSVDLVRGGQVSMLVVGRGDPTKSDLDCAIYITDSDGENHIVAKDEDDTNVCAISVSKVPADGKYRILLLNHGAAQRYTVRMVATSPS